MSRTVYTYSSIKELRSHPLWEKIAKCSQITASFALRKAMVEEYGLEGVIEAAQLEKECLAGWKKSSAVFEQYVLLRRLVKSMEVPEEDLPFKNALLKNSKEALSAIRLLAQAAVRPEELRPEDGGERVFRQAWEALEREDVWLAFLRRRMESYAADPARFIAKLTDFLGSPVTETLVLHGFYFIRPLQERFFDILEASGRKLVFLCCMDPSLSMVEEVWLRNLRAEDGFPPLREWISGSSVDSGNRAFGAVFDGCRAEGSFEQLKIIRYPSVMDFVDDVERIRNDGLAIFSTDKKTVEQVLREFYPELFRRRHLLAYPVGRYIYDLHSMWNEQERRLDLNFDTVRSCLASGWLIVDGLSGQDYLEELDGIRTYVEDCSSFEEWRNRLHRLEENQALLEASLGQHLEDVPPENKRWHRLMGNPFLNLSCFSYPRERLKILIRLIRGIMETAELLFPASGETELRDHMEKIRSLLESGVGGERLYEEEQAVLDELVERITDVSKKDMICFSDDLSAAIILLIGGGILDEEELEVSSDRDRSLVHPMSDAESSSLLFPQGVHLCLADEERLPGARPRHVWPLSDSFLSRIALPQGSRKEQYLKDLVLVDECAPLSARYLFFSLLQNRKIEISWIESFTMDEEALGPSPYIRVLEGIFGISESVFEQRKEDIQDISLSQYRREGRAAAIAKLAYSQPLEASLDFLYCPYRYLYGYLLDEYPSFSKEFHQGFVLSQLVRVLSGLLECSSSEAADQVFRLFPSLTKVSRQQLLDFAGSPAKLFDTDDLDGVSYPKERLAIHFLGKYIPSLPDYEPEIVHISPTGTYRQCMFCPHQDSCPYSVRTKEAEL